MEKRSQALFARLATELLFFIFIIAVVAVTVLLIGRHLKSKIEKDFAVFESFFHAASRQKMPIDMHALDIVEFRKLGVVANEMVTKLKKRDWLIRDYTEKLEKSNRDLKQANARLDNLASRDGLTGVFNRRYFDAALKNELSRSQRQHSPLALFLIDIDYFKTYNDTYGHQLGDICLKNVAETLSSLFRRPADVFTRFGGEEFAALLPATEIRAVTGIAERMHRAIAELKIPHQRSTVSQWVTFSMGIAAIIPDQRTTPQSVIEMADQALYEAKARGRNQFVIGR